MTSSYSVDQERWSKMSIFEQMGNIYSEVGRSFNAGWRNNKQDQQHAVMRAVDLFDITIRVLIGFKSPKAKEVLRAKEVYLNAIYGDGTNDQAIKNLDRYFRQFAIAARLKR